MITLIMLSLATTSLVAFLIALGFYFINANLGFAVFWITFGLEWVIMEPLNRMIRLKSLRQEGVNLTKLEKYEKTVGKQRIALECEYCSEPNPVKIDLSIQNTFVCSKCGNGNKVMMQFTAVRVSSPLELNDESVLSDEEDSLEAFEALEPLESLEGLDSDR